MPDPAPPLVWTTTPPAAPGWYWLRGPNGAVRVAEVRSSFRGLLVAGGRLLPVTDYTARGHQFAGPIPEPVEATA